MLSYQSNQCKKLAQRVEKYNVEGDLDQMSIALNELFICAEKENDAYALMTAHLFAGFLCQIQGNLDNSIPHLLNVIKKAEQEDLPWFLMRSYNCLGSVYTEKADFFTGLSYYLEAYSIASMHPEFEYDHIVSNNIGGLFVWHDEFEIAISYFEEAYYKFVKLNVDDRILGITLIINLVESYSMLENYEKAEYWSENRYVKMFPQERLLILCMLEINQAVIQFKQEKVEKVRNHVLHYLEMIKELDEYIYVCRGLLRLFSITIQIKDYELSKLVFDYLNSLKEKAAIRSLDYSIAVLKVEYYNQFIRQENTTADQFLDEYAYKSTHYLTQMKSAYVQNLISQIELGKSRHENEQMKRIIELDMFTNVYNKVSSRKHVSRLLAEKNPKQFQAFILLDIDNFKLINDAYGHDLGDDVILNIAKSLSENNDDYDKLVGRFGGDEFMIFLNNVSNMEKIESYAESILLQGKNIELPDEQVKQVTFSIGVCKIENVSVFEEVFKCADEALYHAKKSGRNQVIYRTL